MINIKNCVYCGRNFPTIKSNQKYCCKRCRLTANELKVAEKKKQENNRYNPKTGQICWRCQNATNMDKCTWSIGILPKGCIAKKVKIKNERINTYKIISCPLFKEDDY